MVTQLLLPNLILSEYTYGKDNTETYIKNKQQKEPQQKYHIWNCHLLFECGGGGVSVSAVVQNIKDFLSNFSLSLSHVSLVTKNKFSGIPTWYTVCGAQKIDYDQTTCTWLSMLMCIFIGLFVLYVSRHEKTCFFICKKEGADQQHGNRTAAMRLYFDYIENFKPLAIFCGCTAGFVLDLVVNPILCP